MESVFNSLYLAFLLFNYPFQPYNFSFLLSIHRSHVHIQDLVIVQRGVRSWLLEVILVDVIVHLDVQLFQVVLQHSVHHSCGCFHHYFPVLVSVLVGVDEHQNVGSEDGRGDGSGHLGGAWEIQSSSSREDFDDLSSCWHYVVEEFRLGN